jgi:hypothetical protein
MFVNATAWAADPTLSMSSFLIEPGSQQKINLELVQGDAPVLGFQCEIVLPEGLTITGRPKAVAETLEEDLTPTATYSSPKLVVYNSDGLAFKADAKDVVTFTFEAAADFAGGTITLKDIILSEQGNVKKTPADVNVTVTVPAKIEYPSLFMGEFDITAGETTTVPLQLMQNGEKKILGFQCEFVLPEGLTVEGRPKAVAETLEEEMTPTATYANDKLIVYNSDGLLFNINAKDIVKFTFKAAETFESGVIEVKNIVISAEGNEKIEPKGFTVNVNPAIGITNIKTNTSSDIYTISGTRVRTMTRGLYIVNGKKVVVK